MSKYSIPYKNMGKIAKLVYNKPIDIVHKA